MTWAGAWTAIWPNLAANILWVPLAAAHHILTRRRADRHHAAVQERLDAQDAVLGIGPDGDA